MRVCLFVRSRKKTKNNIKIKQLQFEDISLSLSLAPVSTKMANTDFSPPYFPNISRHFMNFSFSSSRNSASTQARKYSEPKQSSQLKS